MTRFDHHAARASATGTGLASRRSSALVFAECSRCSAAASRVVSAEVVGIGAVTALSQGGQLAASFGNGLACFVNALAFMVTRVPALRPRLDEFGPGPPSSTAWVFPVSTPVLYVLHPASLIQHVSCGSAISPGDICPCSSAILLLRLLVAFLELALVELGLELLHRGRLVLVL